MKRAAVITASNRAFNGVYEDTSGQILLQGLKALGYQIDAVEVLPDDIEKIASAIKSAIKDGLDLVVTTGGTGISPLDVTPEATEPLLEKKDARNIGSTACIFAGQSANYRFISRRRRCNK